MARVERLHALTVCINYSEYLRETVINQTHFDTWLVLTCANDVATQALCQEFGIECQVVEHIGASGAAFDSAYSKAGILNIGLSQLDITGWVAIVDADTLLPSDFRERLNAMDLYPRALFGLQGRRDAETWDEYLWRSAVEPWEENLGSNVNILGFCQIFRLDQPHNRYPLVKGTVMMHDDLAFQFTFKPSLRRKLPISCLHVGPAEANWAGRETSAYRSTGVLGERKVNGVPEAVRRLGTPHKIPCLWIVGVDGTTPLAAYAEYAEKLCVWTGMELCRIQEFR